MKKITYDSIVIIASALILILIEYLGLGEQLRKFFMIPLLIVYFIGQYVGRKFPK